MQRWLRALLLCAALLRAPCAGQGVPGQALPAPEGTPAGAALGFTVAADAPQPGCDVCDAESLARTRADAVERWHDAQQVRAAHSRRAALVREFAAAAPLRVLAALLTRTRLGPRAARQVGQAAHRWEADDDWYIGAYDKQDNHTRLIFARRNASREQLLASKAVWTARRTAAAAAAAAAKAGKDAAVPCNRTFELSSRPLARLKRELFPLRPNVTFILQYFRQPAVISPLTAYYHSCTNGLAGAQQARAAQAQPARGA